MTLSLIHTKLLSEVRWTFDDVPTYSPVSGNTDNYELEIILRDTDVSLEPTDLERFIKTFEEQPLFGEDLAILVREQILDALGKCEDCTHGELVVNTKKKLMEFEFGPAVAVRAAA